jgi:hypothetical protein
LVLLTTFFCLADDLGGALFLNNLAGTPIFLKKGLGCIKKGTNAPLLSEKGVLTKFTIPTLPTEFSFGIGMVNIRKIPTGNNQKYQIDVKLYSNSNSTMATWKGLDKIKVNLPIFSVKVHAV